MNWKIWSSRFDLSGEVETSNRVGLLREPPLRWRLEENSNKLDHHWQQRLLKRKGGLLLEVGWLGIR